uniref:B box-type domain-containing protein n=1 Tax=Amphimedon queenslandica TaxID=400682 RepID=A0A1X7UDY0_AMPQE
MDGPKQDGYSSIGCSIHPGESVHKYCQECRALLCFICVQSSDGHRHSQHQDSLISYKAFVKEKEKEALKMLQRLKELRARAEHFDRLLTCYKANFEESYKQSEGYLESFETVKVSMRQWKRDLIEELDSKKEEQVRNINERISQTKEGIVTSRKIEVKLPTVAVFLPLQREMRNKILNLVPRSYTGFSSRGSSERKHGSRHSYVKSSLDDMASLNSITSSVFSPIRSNVSQVSEVDEHTYDEVDSLTSFQTDSVELGETALYKKLPPAKPPPLSLTHNTNDDIRNRPKHPTPIKKEDSKKELFIEQALASTNPSPAPS